MEVTGVSIIKGQREYKWYFLQICTIIFTFVSIVIAKHDILPLTHYTVPDSGYYENWVFYPRDKGFATGFLYLNTFLYSIGVQSFIFYNTVLLLFSIYFCSIFEAFSDKAVTWARASIAFNPYLLISVLGPTKEINLIFLSLCAFFIFFKVTGFFKLLSVIPCIAAMAIRPQFGLIILLAFACAIILRFVKKPMWVCMGILIFFLLLNMVPAINSEISNSGGEELEFFQTSNYYEIALILKLMQENPILQVLALAIKLVLVMFAPVARPNSIFSTYIPLLDWGYTFMGWFLFPVNLSFLFLFIYQKETNYPQLSKAGQLLIIYAFIGIMSTIVSPIIQARYLYPYAPVIAACFMLHNIKTRNRIVVFSAAIICLTFVLTAFFLPKKWDVRIAEPLVFVSWF